MTLRSFFPIMMFITAATAPVAASAEVDTSPGPGGVFRLKPGVYVSKGQPCSDPANAAIRVYDGKGIRGSATRGCVAKIVKKVGNRFTVDETCTDTPAGAGKRTTARQIVTVSNAIEFAIDEPGQVTTYHYCPVYQLPGSLKDLQN
nr:hypothetical protein [Tanacetum cinerariifolium]